jgi:hypothetical protein
VKLRQQERQGVVDPDPELHAEIKRLVARVQQASQWLFVTNLAAAFEAMRRWEWDAFEAWQRTLEPAAVKERVAKVADDNGLREFVLSAGSLDDSRLVYEALSLLAIMVDDPDPGDTGYRTLVARIRFSVSVRDLCIVALDHWERCQ